MSTQYFNITNLTCTACVKVCTLLLKRIEGVAEVMIDQVTGRTTLVAVTPIDYQRIRERLGEKGYQIITN